MSLYLDLTKYSHTGNNHPWVPLTTEGGRCWLLLMDLCYCCYMEHWFGSLKHTGIIIIIITPGQSLWCCHHAWSIARLDCIPWFTRWMQHDARWLPTFGFEPSRSAWTISPPVGCQLTTLNIAFLLLLSPKAGTHFTIPRKVEGWVDLVGWLHTEMVHPLAHGHASKY